MLIAEQFIAYMRGKNTTAWAIVWNYKEQVKRAHYISERSDIGLNLHTFKACDLFRKKKNACFPSNTYVRTIICFDHGNTKYKKKIGRSLERGINDLISWFAEAGKSCGCVLFSFLGFKLQISVKKQCDICRNISTHLIKHINESICYELNNNYTYILRKIRPRCKMNMIG